MSSTLALLGFLALTLLLVCRASMACQRRSSHLYKQRRSQHEFTSRKIEPEKPEIPSKQGDTLLPAQQV
ncbi:MAG: hypothetical protein WB347_07995 [Terriglobales bacterium]